MVKLALNDRMLGGTIPEYLLESPVVEGVGTSDASEDLILC